jgi:hypothetical protein
MRRFLLASLIVLAGGAAGCDPGLLAGPPVDESPSSAGDVGFPCDVRAVLETYCARCHTGLTYATEFLTREDLLTSWRGGVTLGQDAATRVGEGKMPPPGAAVPQPDAAERAILVDWVAAGMPPGPCGPLAPPPGP